MVINLGAGDIVKCPFFEGNTCRVTVTINQAGEIFIRVSDPSTSDSRTKIIPPNTQGYGNDPQIIIQQVSGELFGNGLEVE